MCISADGCSRAYSPATRCHQFTCRDGTMLWSYSPVAAAEKTRPGLITRIVRQYHKYNGFCCKIANRQAPFDYKWDSAGNSLMKPAANLIDFNGLRSVFPFSLARDARWQAPALSRRIRVWPCLGVLMTIMLFDNRCLREVLFG